MEKGGNQRLFFILVLKINAYAHCFASALIRHLLFAALLSVLLWVTGLGVENKDPRERFWRKTRFC